MTGRHTRILGILIALFSFISTGCKTTGSVVATKDLRALSAATILDSVFAKNGFETISAKIGVSYTTEKETRNFAVRARFKKDSIIWLSITPAMGIEVFRVCITADSVKLINRMDQKYFVNSFDSAQQILQLNEEFSVIQALLTGLFPNVHKKDSYTATTEDGQYRLDAEKRSGTASVEHIARVSSNWAVTQTYMHDAKTGDQIAVNYAAFEQFRDRYFPTEMSFRISGKTKISADLKWTRLEMNENLNFPFNIPDKFVAYP